MARRALGWLCAVGSVAGAVVHVASYVPGIPVTFAWILPTLALVPIGWIAMLVRAVDRRRSQPRVAPGSEEEAERSLAVFRLVPIPVWAAAPVVFSYFMFSFFVVLGALRDGQPRESAGRLYLDYKGRFVRDLTPEEYQRLSAIETRLATGHAIIFTAVPALFFLCIDRGRHPSGTV